MAEDHPQVLIVGARRGRPPAAERSIPLSTRLPTSAADRLILNALQRDQTVAAYVREILMQVARTR